MAGNKKVKWEIYCIKYFYKFENRISVIQKLSKVVKKRRKLKQKDHSVKRSEGKKTENCIKVGRKKNWL
jgi:hypothetical protein